MNEDFARNVLCAEGSADLVLAVEEYIAAHKDLLDAALLTGDDEILKEMVRNKIEEDFITATIRDELFKDNLYKTLDMDRDLVLNELIGIAEDKRKIAKEIKQIVSDLKS